MIKKIFLLFLFYLLTRCSNYGTVFEVKNESGHTIDSIKISSNFSPIRIRNIDNESITNSFLNFNNKKNITKGDGSFVLNVFYQKGRNRVKSFGYYSNGVPLVNYFITIQKDSILVREIIK